MNLIKKVNGKMPVHGKNCYFAEFSVVVGDVVMGDDCSVWFGAVIRGDVHYIRMGNKVNVQDGAVIHCTYQKSPTNIGNNVSIGHRAMVHGCTIHDDVLIGMGAIVMDDCIIESNCLIAAGAILLEGTHCPSGGVYAGVPAKRVKEVNADLFKNTIDRISNNYVLYSSWFKEDNSDEV